MFGAAANLLKLMIIHKWGRAQNLLGPIWPMAYQVMASTTKYISRKHRCLFNWYIMVESHSHFDTLSKASKGLPQSLGKLTIKSKLMHLTGLLSSAVDLNYDNMTSCCNTSCEVGRSEGISLIFTLKSFGESIGNSLVPKTDRLQFKTIWEPGTRRLGRKSWTPGNSW